MDKKNYCDIEKMINNNELDKAKAAVERLKKAQIVNEQERACILNFEALINILEGDLNSSENLLQNAIKLDNLNYELYFNLAYIYEIKGYTKLAVFTYSLARNKCVDFEIIEDIAKIINNLNSNAERDSQREGLIILDDYYPNIKTGFRVAEYSFYLENIKNCKVICFNEEYDNLIKEYLTYYPHHKDKIIKFKLDENFNREMERSALVYSVFLNNAFHYLPYYEMSNVPFVFTLYPGGSFLLNNREIDRRLKIICSSPLLKKVIVTQKNVYEYLIKNHFLDKNKIEFIFGCVTFPKYMNVNLVNKKYFGLNKNTFDICFAANKYMRYGKDKGYDIFVEVAKKLSTKIENIRFHVVGGFDENEIDITELKDKIIFYGEKNNDFFTQFYNKIDILLSPNRPFALNEGAFDGFPLNCSTDAALHGVAILASDELNLNICFENNKDICIINLNADNISDKIIHYYNNPQELILLAQGCYKSFNKILNFNDQMSRRMKILSNLC